MSRKKKEIKQECVTLEISGWELNMMLERFFKEKFGEGLEVVYQEFMTDKIRNEHILDHEDNAFKLFIEFKREVMK